MHDREQYKGKSDPKAILIKNQILPALNVACETFLTFFKMSSNEKQTGKARFQLSKNVFLEIKRRLSKNLAKSYFAFF